MPERRYGRSSGYITRDGVNRTDAGQAILLKGSSTGITGTGAVSQDTSGVPGSTESSDQFGTAVSLADLSGYGRADLTPADAALGTNLTP